MKISAISDQFDLGAMALPEFQRGYVWNRDRVRGLMNSLYRGYPVGGLLTWKTRTETATTRGDGPLAVGSVDLLLDGQQRITSLYGIIRGRPPEFFDGNAQSFTDLYFNLEDETFEFYGPVKMRDNPYWINVTQLMQEGAGTMIGRLAQNPEFSQGLTTFINRLNTVANIVNAELHIDQVTGEDKTVDVVVDIFNKVNSGGTKLSKGDLALAKICAEWPEARDQMKRRLNKWSDAGFNFRLEWYLRCVNTIVTNNAMFAALAEVPMVRIRQGVDQTETSIDTLLNLISSRLGLDHDRVLGSRYSFPLMANYLVRRGEFSRAAEQDKLLYWYVHTFLWGRYAGSTETILNQDLELIKDLDDGLDRLIERLRDNRGDLTIRPNDFLGWNRGARFHPLLYMLTRVHQARDWESGVPLSSHLLGKLSSLQMHHIFPRDLLYKHGYNVAEVNALANFTFLTQDTNLKVSNKDPMAYLESYAERHPGAVESHWIPMNRELWRIENYPDFLRARRELLARAANEFLESLISGHRLDAEVSTPVMERLQPVPATITNFEDEEQEILDAAEWVTQQGLPQGEIMFELTDEVTGAANAVLDVAWPAGLQEGLSQPVALLLNEGEETLRAANAAGYRYFTSPDLFRDYVRREILAEEDLAADD